jgi:hypothetical protein
MKDHHHKIQFPCSFPVKAMGLNNAEFPAAVLSIFHKHFKPGDLTCSTQTSSGGKYLSITVTFIAQSRHQLDSIYEELNRNDLVLMTL